LRVHYRRYFSRDEAERSKKKFLERERLLFEEDEKMKSFQGEENCPTLFNLQSLKNQVLIETWFRISTYDTFEKYSFPFVKNRL